jgi:hypothetical protein
MTDEPIKRHCVVCGKILPNNLSISELEKFGAASQREDQSWIFHCVARHTREQIERAMANPPEFHIMRLRRNDHE